MTFEDIEAEINTLRKQLDTCDRKLSKVLKQSEEKLQQPFSNVMSSFLEQSKQEITEQDQALMECKKRWAILFSWSKMHKLAGLVLEDVQYV